METKLKWLSGSRSSPCFDANIVKSSDDSAYQFHFVSPSKLFYIRKEVVRFWEQSDLSWKIPLMCWKYCLLCSWDKFETKMLRVPDTFQINPFIGFHGFEICCYLQQLEFVFFLSFGCTSRKTKSLLLE